MLISADILFDCADWLLNLANYRVSLMLTHVFQKHVLCFCISISSDLALILSHATQQSVDCPLLQTW
jgi:hypothetical protein